MSDITYFDETIFTQSGLLYIRDLKFDESWNTRFKIWGSKINILINQPNDESRQYSTVLHVSELSNELGLHPVVTSPNV